MRRTGGGGEAHSKVVAEAKSGATKTALAVTAMAGAAMSQGSKLIPACLSKSDAWLATQQ